MFSSIRSRLVASYVLMTLLTVGLIGVLALTLFRQQLARQETEYLRANADAVAQQALPLMAPVPNPRALQDLATTSAFLSNTRVRILDANEQLMADSGLDRQPDEYVWLEPLFDLFPDLGPLAQDSGPVIMAIPLDHSQLMPGTPARGSLSLGDLPPGTEYTVIRRVNTPWGNQVLFETRLVPERPVDSPDSDFSAPPTPETAQRATRSVVQPIIAGSQTSGYVELSASLDYGAQSMASARRAFLLAGLGAAMLALIVGLAVSRGLAAPISQLTETASQMGTGDLAARATVRSRDEIGQLATQLNSMAAQLEASFADLAAERDALRRFVADASHELRTPITALKSFNELLQGPAAGDEAARQEFLTENAVQIQRLEWITDNLLNLSRLEAGLVELDLQAHDAAELLEAACSPLRALAQEKGIELEITTPQPPLRVCCDQPRLEMALSNLLDNAIKFTPAGGQVWAKAEAAGDVVRFSVQDTGIGIAPADQAHIFERFYRGKGGDAAGSGLGLAIVQGIAQAHGGKVAVQSTPGQGSRFVLELLATERCSDLKPASSANRDQTGTAPTGLT